MNRTFYGVTFKDNHAGRIICKDELTRELYFFRTCIQDKKYTGPGRWHHGKRVAQMLWLKIIEWDIDGETNMEMDAMWKGLCGSEPELMVTGHKSGGKSTLAAVFAMVWVLCAPQNSGVLMGSTSLGGLRRRIWVEVQKLYSALPEQTRQVYGWQMVGHPTPSFETVKGDKRHGIHGVATGGASESNALDMMRGFHPLRPLIIFDECTSISKAVLDEVANVMKGDCKLIGLGNASDIFDMHGQLMEPKDGWNSVNEDTGKWITKRGGLALHFDGEKSDLVVRGIIRQNEFLFNQSDIDKIIATNGYNSPSYWREVRGFWCPEGIIKSVLSASIIKAGRAQDKAEWGVTKPVQIAMLDPAFEGGDRCVLRFANTGTGLDGNKYIEYTETEIVRIDATSKVPIHHQIARRVKDECQKRGITPFNFALDSTGEGGGVASILKEEWGAGFLEVEFGRRADNDVTAGINDARKASDVYKNQVTQIWYAFREAVQFNQVRGLDAETCIEMCHRLYETSGTPTRITLESKSDMKARGLRSPDFSDAAVVGLHLARRRGYLGKVPSVFVQREVDHWKELAEQAQQAEQQAYLCDPIEVLL